MACLDNFSCLSFSQQVQVAFVSFQNNAVDELTVPADRILEITKTFNAEIFPLRKP